MTSNDINYIIKEIILKEDLYGTYQKPSTAEPAKRRRSAAAGKAASDAPRTRDQKCEEIDALMYRFRDLGDPAVGYRQVKPHFPCKSFRLVERNFWVLDLLNDLFIFHRTDNAGMVEENNGSKPKLLGSTSLILKEEF